MNKLVISCSPANHGGLRTQKIAYIVVHYTAGDGDTARDNGLYFQRNPGLGASAHWFVDETTAVLSVPETHVAWHCGGISYRHPDCRNENSIGVEICSERDQNGVYGFNEETLETAAALIRELMKRYGVGVERVIRHYDVTGKQCPAPLTGAGPWKEFLRMLTRYQAWEELPRWGQDTIRKLLDRNILQGDGQGLDLSRDMLRLLVLLDRSGAFDRPGTEEKMSPAPE